MTSAMVSQFVGLCEATGRFLDAMSGPDPVVVAQHVQNISANLDRFKGRSEAMTPMLLQAVRDLPIENELKNELIRKLATLSASADIGHKSFQDWTAWPDYITHEKMAEWQGIISSQERLRSVVALPFHCGLRQPSEPTFQALTAVYLMTNGSAELTPVEKKTALDTVKTCYRLLGTGPALARYVGKLPKSPEEFRSLCPDIFQVHFGDSPNFVNLDPSVWTLGKCLQAYIWSAQYSRTG